MGDKTFTFEHLLSAINEKKMQIQCLLSLGAKTNSVPQLKEPQNHATEDNVFFAQKFEERQTPVVERKPNQSERKESKTHRRSAVFAGETFEVVARVG